MIELIISILVVYRLTNMISQEEGPFDIFTNIKQYFFLKGRKNFFFKLLSCRLCLSVWIGWAYALYRGGLHLDSLVYGLALSGAVTLIITKGE